MVLALLTFWPLSAFVPLIFAMPQRARLAPEIRRAIAFLAAWILPGWLVMEALPDKLPQHVLPFLPGLALLAGLAIAAHLPIAGRLTVRVGFAFVAAGAALIVFAVEAAAVVLEGRADPAGLAVGTAAVLSAFAASWFLMHGRMAAGIAAAVLASGLVAVLGFAILLPGLPSP